MSIRYVVSLIFAGCSLAAAGQVVHPGGAATVPLNWQPVFRTSLTPDTLALDLDGDQITDVTFLSNNYSFYFPGDTPGAKLIFAVRTRHSTTQVAADSSQPGNAHRFQAGSVIKKELKWDASYYGLYLDYATLNGVGPGAAKQGFFGDGQPGYVVVRKPIAGNAWRYWWINVNSLTSVSGTFVRQVQVNFYGTSLTTLATTAAPAAASRAYPNPTADNWQLPAGSTGAYCLFDYAGRVVGQGQVGPSLVVLGQQLAPGFYWLEYDEAGHSARQKLSKQ